MYACIRMLCVNAEDDVSAPAVSRVHRVVGHVGVAMVMAAVVVAKIVIARAVAVLLKHTLMRGFDELTKS